MYVVRRRLSDYVCRPNSMHRVYAIAPLVLAAIVHTLFLDLLERRALIGDIHTLILSVQQDGLETHGLTLKSAISYVVVRRSVFHHVIDTTLTLVRVEDLFYPPSGRGSLVPILG